MVPPLQKKKKNPQHTPTFNGIFGFQYLANTLHFTIINTTKILEIKLHLA